MSEQRRRFRDLVAAATERILYDNAFDDEEQLLAFFDGLGLQARGVNAVDEAPNVVFPDVLQLSIGYWIQPSRNSDCGFSA